ncbi:MAG: hypothetical protein D6732_08610 [Methanobacteriota archaeon]|nr:MAG: hypothetical protein D6732_08610 [Euryarchaeota archaeon]
MSGNCTNVQKIINSNELIDTTPGDIMRTTNDLVEKGGFFEKAGSIVILVVLRMEKKVLFEDLVTLSSVSRSTVALRVKEFQELGWIIKEEKGRNSEYRLTKEGEKLADKAIELIEEAIVNSDKKIHTNMLNTNVNKVQTAIQDFISILSVVDDLSEKELNLLEGKFEGLNKLRPVSIENLDKDVNEILKIANQLRKELKESFQTIRNESEIIQQIPNFQSALESRYKKADNHLKEYLKIAKHLKS